MLRQRIPPPPPPRLVLSTPGRKRGTSAPHRAPCGEGTLPSGTVLGVGRLRTDGPGSSGVAGDGAPQPCCRKPGPWLRAGSSALPPAPAPNTSSKRARQLHERPAAPAGCWLFFRPAIKLVNTWTRLTKHSSRRKWGVCRNTPLHIVMADINSMLITLCTFQSHILNPFR